MELSKTCVEGLSCFSTCKDKEFEALVKLAFKAAVNPEVASKAAPQLDLEKKRAYASALSLILIAAKNDASTEELKSPLQDATMSKERIGAFMKMYSTTVGDIRTQLKDIRISFGKVLGLSWRLDFYLRSNSYESARIPMYFITLHVRNPDSSSRDVQFTCNYQELQDLLAKLKDAAKRVK